MVSGKSYRQEYRLFLSIADIPLKPISFTGIIAVLYVNDKQYRFASYLGAHIQQMKFIQKDEVHVDIIIKTKTIMPETSFDSKRYL